MLRRPELPNGFQGKAFKASVWEGAVGCVISSCTIGWQQVKVSSIINLLVSTSLGSSACSQQVSPGGGQLPIKTTQAFIYMVQGTGSFVTWLRGRLIV